MKSLVACTFALQLQQTADFLSFADKVQEMSGNNNLQKGLRLTKPKGVQLFPTIVPKVFSKQMFAEQLVFICATVSKRQSFQWKFPSNCFFALHVAGLFC